MHHPEAAVGAWLGVAGIGDPDPKHVRPRRDHRYGRFEPGASPTLGPMQRTDTDKILLFKRNLEKIAMTRAELVEQIQITVKHEIGHYLGLSEEDLERLGLG